MPRYVRVLLTLANIGFIVVLLTVPMSPLVGIAIAMNAISVVINMAVLAHT